MAFNGVVIEYLDIVNISFSEKIHHLARSWKLCSGLFRELANILTFLANIYERSMSEI